MPLETSTTTIALFAILVLVVFLAFFALFLFNIWLSRQPDSLSPYSHFPLRRASDLSYESKEKVLRFLYYHFQYDNRIIEFNSSAFCRETGRIFTHAITWYDKIRVDWTFIQKRFPGRYVSWGSLTEQQQESIRQLHDCVEGFQTEFSSPNSQPNAIEAKYAFAQPGPLYVEIDTKTLVGWKIVPGTELEVLIVQKPQRKLT